jgi:hypothetical protein
MWNGSSNRGEWARARLLEEGLCRVEGDFMRPADAVVTLELEVVVLIV